MIDMKAVEWNEKEILPNYFSVLYAALSIFLLGVAMNASAVNGRSAPTIMRILAFIASCAMIYLITGFRKMNIESVGMWELRVFLGDDKVVKETLSVFQKSAISATNKKSEDWTKHELKYYSKIFRFEGYDFTLSIQKGRTFCILSIGPENEASREMIMQIQNRLRDALAHAIEKN